ncbi:hypothetical protein [Arthrobacter psychrolactophilus]
MSASQFSADTFRHLCRSSPWRWQSVRFELHSSLPTKLDGEPAATRASGPGGAHRASNPTLTCWVRRPGALRVETATGKLLASTTKINQSKDSLFISGNRSPWLLPPSLVNPVKDAAGLVIRRPEAHYGEPAYGSGRSAAALDPAEVAGDHPVPLEKPFANVAEISEVREVEHQGRAALEAIVSPNSSYRPLFPDAPLLFPGRTLLRIDLDTAIAVMSRSLDGSTAGAGHSIMILGVDEYMLNDLFEDVSMGLTDVRAHIPWKLGA